MKILKNKKVVLASAIILGISAITSSALAAYIITGGTRNTNQDVVPSEVEIKNKTVTLRASLDENEVLLFEPKTPYSGPGILHSDGTGDMNVILNLSVEAENKDALGVTTVSVKEERKSADGGTTSSVGNYIVLPKEQTVQPDSFKGTTGTFTATVTLTWTWGSEFGKSDPCAYFAEEDDVETIETKMNAFATAVNGSKFVIEISMAEAAA